MVMASHSRVYWQHKFDSVVLGFVLNENTTLGAGREEGWIWEELESECVPN